MFSRLDSETGGRSIIQPEEMALNNKRIGNTIEKFVLNHFPG